MTDPAAMTPDQLEAALGYRENFARILRADPPRIEFGYDLDARRWPWLALPPQHPVVLDKVQYFSAVTGSLAASQMAPGTRSALTKIGWRAEARPDARHARRGVLEPWVGEQRAGYVLTLFDDAGRENATIRGEGAAFADRDFGAWRAHAKQRAADAAASTPPLPPAADPAAAGLGPGGVCFVTPPLARDGTLVLRARVGAAAGFHPAHPFHTGSGDHVNAAHLFDCALQAAHLVWSPGGTPLVCHAGEAEFLRFVELDLPFEIALAARTRADRGRTRVDLAIGQAGRENTRVWLELEAAA